MTRGPYLGALVCDELVVQPADKLHAERPAFFIRVLFHTCNVR